MRLLYLVEQQDAMGVLVDRIGQQPSLVEADIPGGRADQPRHSVAFHVLRHVETSDLDAQGAGELPRHFGLAYTGRPGKQIGTDRLLGVTQPGPRQLDRGDQRFDRCVLSEHHRL
jgi:hypothetical protein